MQLRYGGTGNPPRHAPSYAVVDYATGVAGAFGVVNALYRRLHTGRGAHVETSLCAGAELLQSLDSAHDGAQPPESNGPDALGVSALRRLYQCADGWLYLDCDADKAVALFEIAGVPHHRDESRGLEAVIGPAADAIAAKLAGRSIEHWLELFASAGISAAPVRSPDGFLGDERMQRLGLLRTVDVPEVGSVTHASSPVELTPGPAAAPEFWAVGAHTEPVLASLGYSSESIADLIAAGVVATCPA
jgi:crotonobetainyl-CoA:carnitine CoA-transferase CaiB-like acyl-CoA transferase